MTNFMDEDSPTYIVRLTEPAETEVETAYLSRMQFGLNVAEEWYAGLLQLLERLALFPNAFPIAPEQQSAEGEGVVRQAIYGRGANAYRVLYRVIETTDDEPSIVRVSHVRHARQGPVNQE